MYLLELIPVPSLTSKKCEHSYHTWDLALGTPCEPAFRLNRLYFTNCKYCFIDSARNGENTGGYSNLPLKYASRLSVQFS